VRSSGTQTALGGQAVADAALAAYADLQTVAADNAYYQGYLRIVDLADASDADVSGRIAARVQAYRQFRRVNVLFAQLCADGAGDGASEAYAALVETLKGFSQDDALSADTRKMAAQLPGDAASLWQAHLIARVQPVLNKLQTEFGALWQKEVPIWDAYIDGVYLNHYASGLQSLRLAHFDDKELAKRVDEPYGTAVKAGLFKLQKYREASQKAAALKQELRRVSQAFEELASTHRLVTERRDGRTESAGPQTRKE
jgi:hypothetical protein